MRYIVFAIIIFLCTSEISAQDVYSSSGKSLAQLKRERERREEAERRKFSTDKLIFGGGFGLFFGNATNISISPIIGYRITESFSAGIGLGYQYFKVKEYSQVYNDNAKAYEWKPFTANIYTPTVWTRYLIWSNVFAHAEYQYNIVSGKEYVNDFTTFPTSIKQEKINYDISSLWLGLGIRQPVSDRVSIILLGLYDVLPDPNKSQYNRFDMRIGINAGF